MKMIISPEWPTQKKDMEAAGHIIDKHVLLNEGEPLGFLEIVMYKNEKNETTEKNKVELKMPDWIVDLQNHFREEYGREYGHVVTSKVLTKFLLKNEVIH